MTQMDEKNQNANANSGWQENQDANANPNTSEVNLDDLSHEELLDYTKKQANEYKEYRRNSQKGQQKLNKKLKEFEGSEDLEERARAIAKEELDKRYIKRTLNSVSNQLTDNQKEAFAEEFEFLTEWRTLDADNVDKYIKKALDLIWWKKPAGIIWVSVWATSSKESNSKAKAEERKAFAKDFVNEMWL